MKKRTIIIRLTVTFIALILINFISYRFFFRIDFTADKSFTLSKATKNLLRNLNEKVSINAYFSSDLPTQLIKSRNDFEDLLIEYKNHSRGKISFTFVNPNANEAQEKLAQAEGIRPVMVNVSERDQVKQLRAYMGASLAINDQKDVIPVIQPGESAEYALTTAIKKLTKQNKEKIAFLQGHGEHGSYACKQLVQQLAINYSIEDYSINDTSEIPATYKTLVVMDPKDSIPPAQFKKIDNYLAGGGSILIAYSGLFGNLSTNIVQPLPENGVREWLAQKGVMISGQIVTDVQCRNVAVQAQAGEIVFNRPIKFPYFPVIKNFAKHPSVKGIEAVFFPFVGSIQIIQRNSSLKVSPLAYTSKKSGLIRPPLMIDVNKEWSVVDFNKGRQIVAVALEGAVTNGNQSKVIVIANGNFAVNSEPGQSELNADNINMAANSIDWLSDDTGLIELRTKAVTYRPLEQVEDSTKEIIKYVNVLSPILLIILIGVIRRYQARKKRKRLMDVTY